MKKWIGFIFLVVFFINFIACYTKFQHPSVENESYAVDGQNMHYGDNCMECHSQNSSVDLIGKRVYPTGNFGYTPWWGHEDYVGAIEYGLPPSEIHNSDRRYPTPTPQNNGPRTQIVNPDSEENRLSKQSVDQSSETNSESTDNRRTFDRRKQATSESSDSSGSRKRKTN